MKNRKNSSHVYVLLRITVACIALISLTGSVYATEILKWTGCGITRKAFMVELAAGYKQDKDILISLSGGGATKGIRDTNAGTSDMGGTCRPTLSDRFPAEEGNVEIYVVAWDALVPIVHKDNPVNNITSQQLKNILTGKITNWKEVGGPDKKIIVVARMGKISGVGYMTRKIIFGDLNIDYTPDALLLKSSGPLENKISVDPDAIGVTGISSAKKRIESGKNLKVINVDNISPTVDNIAAGAYPYFRPLYLAANRNSPSYEQVKAFLEWALSDRAQQIISSVGTVNLKKGKGLKEKFMYWESTDKIVNFDSLL